MVKENIAGKMVDFMKEIISKIKNMGLAYIDGQVYLFLYVSLFFIKTKYFYQDGKTYEGEWMYGK